MQTFTGRRASTSRKALRFLCPSYDIWVFTTWCSRLVHDNRKVYVYLTLILFCVIYFFNKFIHLIILYWAVKLLLRIFLAEAVKNSFVLTDWQVLDDLFTCVRTKSQLENGIPKYTYWKLNEPELICAAKFPQKPHQQILTVQFAWAWAVFIHGVSSMR